jgi:predicted MFS family arabinose efflux permease
MLTIYCDQRSFSSVPAVLTADRIEPGTAMSPAVPNAPDARPALRAAALLRLACAYAVATSGTLLMPLIVAMLMRRFRIGEDAATGIGGLEILGIAVSCALLPRPIARAPRACAAAATIGTIAAQAAGASCPTLAAVGAARAVAGLFEGALFVVVAAALSNRAQAEKAWGVIILVAGVFDGALLVAAAAAPQAWSDRWLFPLFAAAFALIAWPTARAGADAPGAAPARPRGRGLPWRVVLPAWGVMVLVYGVLAAQWAIADVIGHRAGIAPAWSGLLLSLASVLGLAGCLAASHPRSHVLRRPILWGAQALMAGAVTWFFVVRGAADFFAAQLLVTLAFYAVTPFLTARLSELDADGSLVARSVVVTFASVAAGTALAGTMLDALGGLGGGLALAACALASMPLAALAFPRTHAAPPLAAPAPEAS